MKALTISIQEKTYQDLRHQVGQRQISQFIEHLVQEKLTRRKQELIEGYKRTAKSKAMKAEAKIWEGVIEDGIK